MRWTARRMLTWCETHNVHVRFHSNKTVSVRLNFASRRRKTLKLAIQAHEGEIR